MNEIRKYFGLNLKKIRKSRGYSQEYLAEKVGINRRQLTRIETGRSFPSFSTLDNICYVLKVSASCLFDFSDYTEITAKTGTDDIMLYTAQKRSDNVIFLKEKTAYDTIAGEPKNNNNVLQVQDEDGMFKLAKRMNKKIIVEYYQDDLLLKKISYYPDGTSVTEEELQQNDIILKQIIDSAKSFESSLNKLKFIQLAIQCLEDKDNVEKLRNVLDGMLL